MDTMRTFVSISVPNFDKVHKMSEEMKHLGTRMRSNNLHITLKFIGDLPADRIDDAVSALERSVANMKEFSILLKGIGAFPSVLSPRIIWIGTVDDGSMTELSKRISTEFDRVGILYDKKPFKPHITVSRIDRASTDLVSSVKNNGQRAFGTFICNEIALMKSVLSSGGAEHSVIRSIGLTK